MAETSTATMDFFGQQDAARRESFRLVVYYALAVVLIIAAVYLLFALLLAGQLADAEGRPETVSLWNPKLLLWVCGGTLTVVLLGSLYKIAQLSGGGEAVARMLGGRPLNTNTRDLDERKVLNVVEEMAIASGTPVPRVFLLERERGINAFAAGFTPRQAVIAVTRGCIEQLSREELQGVIAHEFSHILNGDMRLNIRLTGVLHGILLIALAGYGIMRVALHTRGDSRRGGGVLPFLLLGVVLMLIGYVGVFFGRLIKSAVSRQREFLADASAVQFTRNPGGIAGALKKIGAYKPGSRVADAHAEQASHFFFADALSAGLFRLLATHPPLKERIRRLDPSFDGVYRAPSRRTRAVPPPPVPEPVAEYAVDPEAVLSRVGTPQAEHLDLAAGLLAALPPALAEAAREPFGARAVVYALLLDRRVEVRRRQLARLAEKADRQVFAETRSVMPGAAAVRRDAVWPLVDRCISALKDLSAPQYAAFRANVEALVEADEQIDLFEYTLQRALMRHLEPAFRRVGPPAVRYGSVAAVAEACRALLSCLARWGAADGRGASAFARGAGVLGQGVATAPLPASECSLQKLDHSLDRLAQAAPAVKKRVLAAATACIGADGKVTVEEAEVLRAVADSLDCPVPPFLPSA